ncbi:MAG: complex I NDUFA9 subunit family protein [Pseudomonadota bacterium]
MEDVLILGGSGFLGCRLCEMLVEQSGGAAGSITVATRHAPKARHLLVLPDLDVIEADVHRDDDLARLVAGRSSVVNLVGVLHGDEAVFRRAHAELPGRLGRACRQAGVGRVVHVSALGAASQAPSMYLRSKAEGEAALAASGMPATVLRPSVMFGAHDQFLNLFARLARAAPVIPLACADARLQPVWVDDVARAVIACLQAPQPLRQVFECAGPNVYTLRELVDLAARCSGHGRRIVALPEVAGRLQAWFLEHLPGDPLMTRDNLDSMQVPNVASGQLPGLAELGIRPTPLEAVMPQWLAHHEGRQAELQGWRRGRAPR